jgi:Fe-S-cluster containining protein
MREQGDLDAGDFASWLAGTRTALWTGADADVPCGDCNGCCKSSYFIHVRPDEAETLARIPRELLFAAPGLPKGNVLMGYNEHGCCPMLLDGACSIYEHRPATCRIYDCRVFTATGVAPTQPLVLARTERWAFTYASSNDSLLHSTARDVGRFLQDKTSCFPAGSVPSNPAQLAVLAIKSFSALLDPIGESAGRAFSRTDDEIAKAILQAAEEFDSLR